MADKEVMPGCYKMYGNLVRVMAGANGLIINQKAFYDVHKGKVTLERVFMADGNTEYPEDSPAYKFYKQIEDNLTLLYGHLYCPKHYRKLGLVNAGECDICNS